MARKKSAKTQKTKPNPSLSASGKMEKDFRSMPSQLAASYRAELNTLKQQEQKVKSALKTTLIKANVATKKHSNLTQSKSASAKKQLNAAKKTHASMTKTIKELSTKLEQIQKSIQNVTTKQATFAALAKELKKLEKQLSAKMKKNAKPAKSRKLAAKKPTVKKTQSPDSVTNDPSVHDDSTITMTSQNESVEMEN